jgi:hypothetical protein
MGDSAKKAKILEKAGFSYHFSRMIYINDEKRKVFSHEAIDDNPVNWLKEKINEASVPDDWQFYFSGTLNAEIKRDVLREIAPNYVKD